MQSLTHIGCHWACAIPPRYGCDGYRTPRLSNKVAAHTLSCRSKSTTWADVWRQCRTLTQTSPSKLRWCIHFVHLNFYRTLQIQFTFTNVCCVARVWRHCSVDWWCWGVCWPQSFCIVRSARRAERTAAASWRHSPVPWSFSRTGTINDSHF